MRYQQHRTFVLLLASVTLFTAAPVWSAEKSAAASRARTIAPAIDSQTVAVGYVDLTRVDLAAFFSQISTRLKLPKDSLVEPQAEATKLLESFRKAGGTELYAVISLVDVPKSLPLLVVPLKPGANERELQAILKQVTQGEGELTNGQPVRRFGDLLVAGSQQALDRVAAKHPDPRREIELAFAAAKDAPLQIHFTLSAEQRRVATDTLAILPDDYGLQPGKAIADGLRWGTLLAENPDLSTWRITVRAATGAAAKLLQKPALAGLDSLRKLPGISQRVPQIDRLVTLLAPTVTGNELTAKLDDKNQGTTLLAEIAEPVIRDIQDRVVRQQVARAIRPMMVAMFGYAEAKKSFPPAALRDKQQKPLLSWRVLLLPYLNEKKLYDEFHLDEPWDSAHNQKLVERMPSIYRSRASKLAKPGYTTFLAPLGQNTAFAKPEGTPIRDFRDGLANTIMIVDVGDEAAVIWTKPVDWQYDPNQPLRGLIGHHRAGFMCILADGTRLFIRETMPVLLLNGLFTPKSQDRSPESWDGAHFLTYQ